MYVDIHVYAVQEFRANDSKFYIFAVKHKADTYIWTHLNDCLHLEATLTQPDNMKLKYFLSPDNLYLYSTSDNLIFTFKCI